MDELARKHAGAKFVFVLEGVAMYFEKAVFREFVLNLSERFEGLLLADLINKFAAKSNTRKHDVLKFMKGDVKFKMSVEGAGGCCGGTGRR